MEKKDYEKYREEIIKIANSTEDTEMLKKIYTYSSNIARKR